MRTRYIDDGVREAFAGGARQVLILGCGFDCRALRMGEIAQGCIATYEVDFAEQLRAKREILTAAGVALPAHVVPVACDLASSSFETLLTRALRAAGYATHQQVCMIWEGVIGYLDDATVDRSLRWLANAGSSGSRLLYNYQAFRLAPAAFTQRVRAAGFAHVDEHGCDELYHRYLACEPPPGGEMFRVAQARVA
jgi:methyltransferase (TIGR00027 family)